VIKFAQNEHYIFVSETVCAESVTIFKTRLDIKASQYIRHLLEPATTDIKKTRRAKS